MRTFHILLVTIAAVCVSTAAMATDGVASASGRWHIAPPISQVQNRSWSSPLATRAASTKRETRHIVDRAFSESRRYSAGTEWATRAALFALSATGKITGGGRDNTADIGKRPLSTLNSDASPFGSFSGGIR